jgi:hypothetical protein
MNSRLSRHTTAALGHLNSLKRNLIILSTVGGLVSLLGCQSALEDACLEFPEVQAEIKVKITSLEPYVPVSMNNKKRSLASIKSTTAKPTTAFPPEMKLSYMDWAEGLLKRSQWVRDGLETGSHHDSRKALNTLSDATLNLVSIHGWFEQGKVKKAKLGLEQLSDQLELARQQACGTRY